MSDAGTVGADASGARGGVVDPRAACIIGVAQRTVHPGQGPAPEPLVLWEEVVRAAAADTGVTPDRVLHAAGSLAVLYCQSWPYDDPAGRLADRLGIAAKDRLYSGIGGTTPHVLVTRAARAIADGDCDVAVIAGAEALETLRQAKKAGERLAWSHRDPERKPFPFEAPFHPAEVAHGVFQAWLTFAVFDVARRAHLGVEPAAYRLALGELMAPMTEVAEANPHAWFRTRRSAEELIEPTPSNRLVGYPYTKTMVAMMDVDMAAALVVASHQAADDLGVPAERRVYLRGWGEANDATYVAEHDPMWASPAMRVASKAAFEAAGIGTDDVAHLDLYSCFASSLDLACDALGLATDDSRGLTVTGGLPFFGGPGSGYMLHSTATMVERLRAGPGSFGLVSGVGMHMTKHAYDLYSTEAPANWPEVVNAPPAAGSVAAALTVRDLYEGPAAVAAYSVVHDRSGTPEWGLAICDLPDGARAYARFDEPGLLGVAEEEEWVGATVRLRPTDGGVNRLT
ncbi:MAG: acetyl-CoA synthetase [Acidimicrobiales bacterium]